MAILNCPECNGKVSDKIDNCPHCGYPIKESVFSSDRQYTVVNGVEYDVTEIINLILSNNNKNLERARNIIVSNMDISPIKFIKPVYELKSAPKEINCETLTKWKHIQQKAKMLNPKCPTCQSIDIRKISATSKVVNTALFGIVGTKRHKTFHCNNCGYEW